MLASSEKKWRSAGAIAGLAPSPAPRTRRVTPLGPRDAEAVHEGSEAGSCAGAARLLGPHAAVGRRSPAETGSSSESAALPGTHTSWHMSHSAEAPSLTRVPGLASAAGV